MALETKVLVIVPLNDEIEYINECIDSILNSSLGGVEVAISSGYIHSEIKEKISWYTKKYDRVRLFTKGSVAEAIESAVSSIKSEYIFFMNIYDKLMPESLEHYYEAATSYGADIVFGRVNHRRNSLTLPSDLLPFSDGAHIADEYLAGLANGKYKDGDKWTKFYLSSFVKPYIGEFLKLEETEWLTFIFSFTGQFAYLDFISLERNENAYEDALKEEAEWTLPEDVIKKRLSGIELCYAEGNSARVELVSRVLIKQLNKYIIESKGESGYTELREKIERGEELRKQAILEQERKEIEATKKKNNKTAWWVKWIIFAILAMRLITKVYSIINGMQP